MASVKYSVQITGPAMSFLYYSSSSFMKEGFLLGTVVQQQINLISDADEGVTELTTIIRVTGVLPCSQEAFDLMNSTAQITCKGLMESVGLKWDDSCHIVGWFSCRKNSHFKPSFREASLHSFFAGKVNQNEENFIFALLQNSLILTSMTREFHAKFFHCNQGRRGWSLLNGSVLNWNQKQSEINKTAYRSLPTVESQLLSVFANEPKIQGRTGTDFIAGIIDNAHSYTKDTVQRIALLNADIERVKKEILDLRRREASGKVEKSAVDFCNENLMDESLSNEPSSSPTLVSRRVRELTAAETEGESGTLKTKTIPETATGTPEKRKISRAPRTEIYQSGPNRMPLPRVKRQSPSQED